MHNHRFITLAKVVEITTWSRASVYRKAADGSFPRPIKIGQRRVAWTLESIANWQKQQLEAASN